MPATCTACSHTRAIEIDQALVSGVPIRTLSRRFGVSRQSLTRHLRNHLGKALSGAVQRAVAEKGDVMLALLESTVQELDRLQKVAERKGNLAAVGVFTSQKIRLLELGTSARSPSAMSPADLNIEVSFGPRGAEVRPVPRDAAVVDVTPEPPAEPTIAQREEEAHDAAPETVSPAQETTAPKPSPSRASAQPPAPPVQPPHICGPKCTRFSCVVKNEAGDDPGPTNPKGWEVF